MDGSKSSKDMFVTQENLNQSYKALMREILNLGDAMKFGFESVKTELRGEMKAMGDELRGEMKSMGDELRGEMKSSEGRLRKETSELRSELSELRKDFQDSRSYFTKEIGELRVESHKTLAKVEEVHTLAVYALDGYRILCDKNTSQDGRIDSLEDFISKF